jgi:hypothetical protein
MEQNKTWLKKLRYNDKENWKAKTD